MCTSMQCPAVPVEPDDLWQDVKKHLKFNSFVDSYHLSNTATGIPSPTTTTRQEEGGRTIKRLRFLSFTLPQTFYLFLRTFWGDTWLFLSFLFIFVSAPSPGELSSKDVLVHWPIHNFRLECCLSFGSWCLLLMFTGRRKIRHSWRRYGCP